MGQKDLAAKQFERSPKVFADIINAFIFEGEQVVSSEDLQPAPTEFLYPATDGELHNQYNDVSKYEMKNGRIVTQYTLENQSRPDYKILLRKAGYEGAIYRQQYNGKDTYPAITLVLYWGDTAWNSSSDLLNYFRRKKIHCMARQYIDNVCLHLFSMRRLPREIRQRFQSDMRIVVDYLAEGREYEPTEQEIVNIEATMRMLHALTGETDFLNNIEIMQEHRERGGKVTMCEVVDKFVERGIKEEKRRCAEAFVKETVLQKQPKEYITGILRTCFQLREEEADDLYRECTEIRLFAG